MENYWRVFFLSFFKKLRMGKRNRELVKMLFNMHVVGWAL